MPDATPDAFVQSYKTLATFYSIRFHIDDVNKSGFSTSTLFVPTLDAGVTFNTDLAILFLETFLSRRGARPSSSVRPSASRSSIAKMPIARRYAVSLQSELPGRLLVELAFVYNANYDMRNATASCEIMR